MTTGALERIIRRGGAPVAPVEPCDMCALPIAARHRHALDTERAELMCLCRACALLFDRSAASDGHYRLVPERRLRLGEVDTQRLGVPVGLAYFVPDREGAVVAHYPSPLGATRWEVDGDAWSDVVAECPALGHLEPEVEALLVNTTRGARHRWLVPIDDCFALNALVGREWRGMTGGDRVWPAIEEFFTRLEGGAHGFDSRR